MDTTEASFKTPGGNWERMMVRDGTSDWNTCNSSGPHDEYGLPSGLQGWALDVGAHIGAVTVPLLLDNPDLRVVAVEALPENAELLDINCKLNGVRDRVRIFHGAAGDGEPQMIGYGPAEGELNHSQFIGSVDGGRERYYPAVGVSLGDMLWPTEGHGFDWVKLDCEKCEYPLLSAASQEQLTQLRFITGEHHAGFKPIVETLHRTHRVEFISGDEGFGHFEAVAL